MVFERDAQHITVILEFFMNSLCIIKSHNELIEEGFAKDSLKALVD